MRLIDNKGVTLLELVVSAGLFIVITLAAAGVFRMIIEGQRNAIASQNVQESMRYALEMMAKELRMAQRFDSAACNAATFPPDSSGTKEIFNKNGNSQPNVKLTFVNKNGDCTLYDLASTGSFRRLRVTRQDHISGTVYSGYLTPSKINVQTLDFVGVVENPLAGPYTYQPKITLVLEAEMYNPNAGYQHKDTVMLQTSITSRHYER